MLLKPGKEIRSLLILLCGFFALVSCETKGSDCFEPVLVTASNSFQRIDTQRVFYYIPPDSTLTDSLRFVARDSVMPRSEIKVLDLSTPFTVTGSEPGSAIMRVAFNPAADSIRYTFRADTADTNAVMDTITFYYLPKVHFISNNCGYNYYYTINNVVATKKQFDSLRILNNNVTNDVSVRNVQFYFKRKP